MSGMARILLMQGAGVPTCLLLLATFSATTTHGLTQGLKAAVSPGTEVKHTATQKPSVDMASQETKKIDSEDEPSKRQIRKFDFDDEFAKYLGLASHDETARYLSGDKSSSYRAPNSQENGELNVFPQLRLAGSTPASFAYFTQIYPDEDSSGGDIRIEHFNPVTHPRSSERETGQYNEEYPQRYGDRGRNYHASDSSAESLQTLQPPPTSRSYFGRLSNKPKSIEFTSTDFVPKLGKLRPEKPYKSKDYDEESPDYKTGYRQFGMYHKFTEEDLYPKKTSSEWIPTSPKQKAQNQNQAEDEEEGEANDFEDYQEDYQDAPAKSEEYHVKSEHDDEVTRIKDSIENDPPYATTHYDLAEKEGAAINPKASGKGSQEEEDYGNKGYTPKSESAESSLEANEQVRKHKRPGKNRHKHKKPHFHFPGGPGFRSSANVNINAPFPVPAHRPNAEFKAPSFEFRSPVNTFVSPPYTPPQQYRAPPGPYRNPAEPYRGPLAPYQTPPEQESYRTSPEHYRSPPENEAPTSAEGEKEGSYEEQNESSDDQANADAGSGHEPEDVDDDYRAISEAGQKEHAERTKDLDQRIPTHDGKLYGSFEAFDSQLEPNKKFDPFVQYPFERERKQLKTAVDDLIEDGKIDDRSER